MSETRIPEALALLREKGWCKNKLDDAEGRHCLIGALIAVHSAQQTLEYKYDVAATQATITAQHGARCVTTFNDDPATTFEMVEAVLEKAALERGGSL